MKDTGTKERKEEMINANKTAGILSVILFLLSMMTISCSENNISFNEEIPDEGWSRYHIPAFEASITDTADAYDILISIRNSYNYPYRNIFLFVSTTLPSWI